MLKLSLLPMSIGSLTLNNRIIMQPMHLGWCQEGFVNDRMIGFFRQRASCGTGMIIVGGCAIDEVGSYGPSMISIGDDRYEPGLAKLVQAIKNEGSRVAAQLFHAGRYASMLPSATTKPPVAPSAIPSGISKKKTQGVEGSRDTGYYYQIRRRCQTSNRSRF